MGVAVFSIFQYPWFKMFVISAFSLKVIAGFVWYLGSMALFLKGKSLAVAAHYMHPESFLPYGTLVLGLGIGLIKARYLFINNGKKNVERIYALQLPRIWNFFRPRFFFLLALMIGGGAALSTLAQNNFPFLLSVACIDFSLAFALSISGYVYWKKR